MKTFLKHKLAMVVGSIKLCRAEEQAALFRGRALRGDWPKRHIKGEEKPIAPNNLVTPPKGEKLLDENKRRNKWFRSMQWSNAVDEDVAQTAINEAYEKFWGLERFRKTKLRPEARHTCLALGFLNGKQYAQIEAAGCYELPDFKWIEDMLFPGEEDTYAFSFTWESQEDVRSVRQRWAEWLDKANEALTKGVAKPSSTDSPVVSA